MNKFIVQSITGKRILITGGTGCFGKNILTYLQDNNVELELLTIVTRNAEKFKCANPQLASLPFIQYKETDVLYLKYDGTDYDYVIHGATSVVDKVAPIQLLNEITQGVQATLKVADQAQAKAFINISSGAVYGSNPELKKLMETHLGYPKIESASNSYGLGKLMSEHYCYLYSLNTNMKITSLRSFAIGGAYINSNHYVLGYLVEKALKNESIIVQSGRGNYRSYLSTKDLVEWILTILVTSATRNIGYEVYNIGSDEGICIPELASRVVSVLSSNSKIDFPNLNNQDVYYYVPDTTKAKILGLKMQHSLEQIIMDTAAFYRGLT